MHSDWTQSNQHKKTRRAQNVTWTRVGTAPSIPARNQSHGYLQDCNGDLHPRPAPVKLRSGEGDDKAGPGDYDVDDHALRPVRTCDFGRASSKRSLLTPMNVTTAGPSLGPKPWCTGKWEDVPAPGQYDPFPKRLARLNDDDLSRKQQTFSKQTGRQPLIRSESETPGVGSYDIQANSPFKSAAELKKRRAALCLKDSAPFQSQAPRFHSPSDSRWTPGPGAYDIHEQVGLDPDLIAYKNVTRSAFGVGSERFRLDRKEEVPGPGQYVIERTFEPRYKNGRISSFFQSQSKRFVDKTQGPPPTAYQKLDNWRRTNRVRCKTAAFLSSQKTERFVPRKSDAPGPGSYAVQERAASRAAAAGAALKFTSKRFDYGTAVDGPGVGTYDLRSHDSLVKRSFNITISDEYH